MVIVLIDKLNSLKPHFAGRRVTGEPLYSSPRRRATSTQILETTNNHKPYFIKHRTGFCLLGFISDVLTTSSSEERANSRVEKRKCNKAGSRSKVSWAGRNFEATFSWQLSVAPVKAVCSSVVPLACVEVGAARRIRIPGCRATQEPGEGSDGKRAREGKWVTRREEDTSFRRNNPGSKHAGGKAQPSW